MFSPAPRVLQRLISLGQPPPRTRKRGADGVLLDLQHLGDLVVPESFFLEQQRLPVALTKLFERVTGICRFLGELQRKLHRLLLFLLRLGGHQHQLPPLP